MHAGNDVVDTAVAAHSGDDVEAFHCSLTSEFGAVVYALGIAHFVVVEIVVEVGVK